MILNIKGNDIKFGYGLYFLGKAQKENNTDLNGLLQSLVKNPIADMVDLMYYSAKCEAELDEVKLSISKRDLLDYLEQNNDFNNADGALSKWSAKLVESVKGLFTVNETETATKDEELVKKK